MGSVHCKVLNIARIWISDSHKSHFAVWVVVHLVLLPVLVSERAQAVVVASHILFKPSKLGWIHCRIAFNLAFLRETKHFAEVFLRGDSTVLAFNNQVDD